MSNSNQSQEIVRTTELVKTTNFMNGVSFKLSALKTLQIVMTSMITGEAQHYRTNKAGAGFKGHFLLADLYESDNKDDKVENYVQKIISSSLDEDFEGTIKFISILRNEYLMRLNPQVILIAALRHSSRVSFNEKNPKMMRDIISDAGPLPTDWCKQFELMKLAHFNPPSIWKRTIAEKLENMSRYHAVKYINGGKTGNKTSNTSSDATNDKSVLRRSRFQKKPLEDKKTEKDKIEKDNQKNEALASLVDLIRITHPIGKPGSVVEEIVKTGKVQVTDESEETWERLKSSGKSWKEIIEQIRLPHMALLRNIRGILQELSQDDEDRSELVQKIGDQLVAGVLGGKQFPFRYFSAHRALKGNSYEKYGVVRTLHRRGISKQEDSGKLEVAINPKYMSIMEKSLEACLQKSLETIPCLTGRIDALTDNSGSAHGAFTSEYGSVKVAEISNLSAILTAMRATEGGSVWIFGDRLKEFRVDPNGSILEQLDQVNKLGADIGGGTESGVWLFWEKMITNKTNLDHVFIYSDQQAGYGGLYTTNEDSKRLNEMKCSIDNNSSWRSSQYIDVLKLVSLYREKVKRKVNLFTIQVAGYDNTVLPDLLYRGAILSGWTGKEAKMAYEMIKLWDEIDL